MEDPIGVSDAKSELLTEEDKTSQSLQNSSERKIAGTIYEM